MGELYEAEDTELHERIALKTILSKMADERSIQMFKREVHLARQVTHPNVCRIFDVFRHQPRPGARHRRGRARGHRPGDGVAERRDPRRQAPAGRTAHHGGGPASGAADGGRPHRRASCRCGAPRLQEPERHAREALHAGWGAAGRHHGLWPGQAQLGGRPVESLRVPERCRRDFGHPRLHGAGAGRGGRRDAGDRRLCDGGRALRDGHRGEAVRGRHPAQDRGEAAPGAGAVTADPPARSGRSLGGGDLALPRKAAGRPFREPRRSRAGTLRRVLELVEATGFRRFPEPRLEDIRRRCRGRRARGRGPGFPAVAPEARRPGRA